MQMLTYGMHMFMFTTNHHYLKIITGTINATEICYINQQFLHVRR
jgi:hypothetical protein